MINYTLNGGLGKKQIELMHEKAIYLLEKVGINIPHKGILKLLSDYNGVKIEKDNVRFNGDLVLKSLEETKYPLPEYFDNNWIISSGANQTRYYDLNTGKNKEPTLDDVIELTKLCDSMNTVGAAPLIPFNQPQHLQ